MKKRKIPMRKCVGCQEMKPKKTMLRVVNSSENQIDIDTTGKKSGRGAYVCYDEACLEKAMKNKGLERGLETKISQETYEAISYSIKRYLLLNQNPEI